MRTLIVSDDPEWTQHAAPDVTVVHGLGPLPNLLAFDAAVVDGAILGADVGRALDQFVRAGRYLLLCVDERTTLPADPAADVSIDSVVGGVPRGRLETRDPGFREIAATLDDVTFALRLTDEWRSTVAISGSKCFVSGPNNNKLRP